MRFGAKAGLNISTIVGDDIDSKIGFHVSAVAEIPLTNTFTAQPELLFSTQGAKNDDATLSLNYINTPLIEKYYVAEGFSLQSSPQIGILVTTEIEDEDVKDGCKSIDLGFDLSAGYQLESAIFFDTRYNLGLANIANFDDTVVKNSIIPLSVGYKF